MASRIKHSFKDGMLALVKGGWANRVARVCSYWAGKNGIDVLIPENPSGNSPCMVSLNIANATKLIVNEMTGNLGIKFSGMAHTLELRVAKKTNSSGVVSFDKAVVFLPSLTLKFAGSDYTVTGVTATSYAGWYTINGRTTGQFWLVEGSTAGVLSFSNAASSDTTKLSYYVGSIGANDPWDVEQYSRAFCGNAVVTDEASVSREVNTAKIDTSHSTFPDSTSSFPSSYRTKDAATWSIGDKGTGSDANKEVGVKFSVITRLVDGGGGSFYAYSRTLTFSKAGILTSVSAENGGVAISEG